MPLGLFVIKCMHILLGPISILCFLGQSTLDCKETPLYFANDPPFLVPEFHGGWGPKIDGEFAADFRSN